MKRFFRTTAFLILSSLAANADDFVGKFQPEVEDQITKKMVLRDDPIVITKAEDGAYRLENNEWTGIAYLDKASGVYRALLKYRSKPKDPSRPAIGPQYFENNLVLYSTFTPDEAGKFKVANIFHRNGQEMTTWYNIIKAH